MNPTSIALIGAFGLLAASCAPDSPPLRPESTVPDPAQPTALELARLQPRLTYAQAQSRTSQIKVGMPQSHIEAMFGPPDQAGKEVYGRGAGTPWEALVWAYHFNDVQPGKTLFVVFQEANGEWLVNRASW